MSNTLWFEIAVSVSIQVQDAVSNYMFELGASGVEERENVVVAWFSEQFNSKDIVSKVGAYLLSLQGLGYDLDNLDSRITVEFIKDQDWNAEWKKQFTPFLVSPTVMIKPTWCDLPAEHPQTVIELDPEMAFGTGTHATTALCAQLLEGQSRDKVILDAGTGTGLLSIIALKQGAKSCYGFDVDPLATQTARNNAFKNSTQALQLFTGDIKALNNIAFDLIVANINSGQLKLMMHDFYRLLHAQGTLILSGILDIEGDKMAAVLAENGFHLFKRNQQDEWLALVSKKAM